jgi:hypothetical protein
MTEPIKKIELAEFISELDMDFLNEQIIINKDDLWNLIEPYLQKIVKNKPKDFIKTYEKYKFVGYMPCKEEYYGFASYSIYGIRLETDEEYVERLERELKIKADKQLEKRKQKLMQEEREKKELERLAKKYNKEIK